MRLDGDSMLEIYNCTLVAQCASECLKRDVCRSFNFIEESRLCQLSNWTHEDPGAEIRPDHLSRYITRDTFTVDEVGID